MELDNFESQQWNEIGQKEQEIEELLFEKEQLLEDIKDLNEKAWILNDMYEKQQADKQALRDRIEELVRLDIQKQKQIENLKITITTLDQRILDYENVEQDDELRSSIIQQQFNDLDMFEQDNFCLQLERNDVLQVEEVEDNFDSNMSMYRTRERAETYKANESKELDEKKQHRLQEIEDLGYSYNILVEQIKDDNKLERIFTNINEIVANKNSDMMSFIGNRHSIKKAGVASDQDAQNMVVSRTAPNLSVYTEKLHIYENNTPKEIVLVVYNGEMNFLFVEKKGQFMNSINIGRDVDRIIKCSMVRSNNYCSLAISQDDLDQIKPDFQYIALKLTQSCLKS